MMWKSGAILLAWAAMLATGGCASTSESVGPAQVAAAQDKQLRAGQVALERRDYREAEKYFHQVLEADPQHPEARLGLAESLLGAGAINRAIETFEQVDEQPATRLSALQGLGIAQLIDGEMEHARRLLLQVTAEDPSRWRAWNALARCYDLDGAFARSADAYARALASTSEPALIQNNWGVSLIAQTRYAEAEEHFLLALKHDPAMAKAQTNLRLALAYQGRYAEALAGVGNAELPQTLNNVGYVALLRGELKRAEAYFLRAIESSPSFYQPAAENLRLLGGMKQIAAGA